MKRAIIFIKRIYRYSASEFPYIPSPLRGEGEGEGVGTIFHPPLSPLPSREGTYKIPRSLLLYSSLMFLLLVVFISSVYAQLDLEQEVLIIPDTHNEKPYIWNVLRNPKDYDLSIEYDNTASGNDTEYTLTVRSKTDLKIDDIHVFIADHDLHEYAHIIPVKKNEGSYFFRYNAAVPGKYRIEIVFRTQKGWINLRKDIRIKVNGKTESVKKQGDEDYHVSVKLIPKKAYAEHVVTFLYELNYKGIPLKDIEKIGGADMQVAAWDEDMKEFIYAVPRQNLGGPEVAVSFVFMLPGKHAVFAEFKHNGINRKVELVINVHEEPKIDESHIESLKPSEF